MEINIWIVLLTAVVSMAIMSLWYSPIFFGKAWQRLAGISDEQMSSMKKKGMGPRYLAQLAASIVMAYVLGYLAGLLGLVTFTDGVWIGFMIWLGFFATSILGSTIWEGKPTKLYFINAFGWLVNLCVMGGILVTML